MHQVDDRHTTQYLLARYWQAALGFWRKDARRTAWLLTIAVFSIALLNLGLGLLLNIWNRVMFDGLENRDMRIVVFQSIVFLPLVLASLAMAVSDTYSKMSLQRRWRAWLNGHVLDRWLTSGRYYQLTLRPGEHSTPESRVAEDLRLSVDAPVDIVLGVFAALITLITYIGVLWYIGGEITIPIGTMMLRIPGFLVITAFLYAVLASGAMVKIARGFVPLAESRSQAEADYRYALTRLRENAESIALLGGDAEERAGLDSAYKVVRGRWRAVMMQSIRTTIVGNTTNGLAPIIPLLLCAPKYVSGTMTLGEMMQAASAFITVQHSFNWLVENYPRVADWTAAARRLASLLVSLDRLDGADGADPSRQIVRMPAEEGALRLRGLSLTSDDGSAIVDEADIEIAPGEKVLVVGESGTGKSTLVRAIAGLWPWGAGEVGVQRRCALRDAAAPLRAARDAPTRRHLSAVAGGGRRRGGAPVDRGRWARAFPQSTRCRRTLGSGALRGREAAARICAHAHTEPNDDRHGRGDRRSRSSKPGSVDGVGPGAPPRGHPRQRGASRRARSISHAQARARILRRRRAIGR